MTICIAAIGTESLKEFIVFATDHMITTGSGQFEHSISKFRTINKNTVAMISGQALLFDDLICLDDSTRKSSYEEIKKRIFENFRKKKAEVIQNEIFSIYGINHAFFVDSLQKPVPNPFIHTILERVSNFNLNTNILIVGFDNEVAMISEINESGSFNFRSINFHCIGSGQVQAANTLLFQKQSKKDTLSRTLFNVYKAKRNAEVAQGVGRETDMFILTQKVIRKVSEENLNILKTLYEEESEFGKNNERLKSVRWV